VLNGKTITEVGIQVDPQVDTILVNGNPVYFPTEYTYYILNKPVGYITTLSDPHQKKAITTLFPPTIKHRIYPVGRLDLDSEGLLLLTNDGELTQLLLHPRYEIPRIYQVLVSPIFSPTQLDSLRMGMELEEGHTGSIQANIQSNQSDKTWLQLTLYQGWKRQIRRMLGLLGSTIHILRRIGYGPLLLGDLPIGSCRRLNKKEIEQLNHLKKTLQNN